MVGGEGLTVLSVFKKLFHFPKTKPAAEAPDQTLDSSIYLEERDSLEIQALKLEDVIPVPLPTFKYYPDPVGNESIIEKLAVCPCCEKPRNYMYTGNIYCVEEIEEVCPWCIADGSAAEKWDAGFIEDGYCKNISPDILEEINSRTPGFETWQGSRWLFSETDAMLFRGEVDGGKLVSEGNTSKIRAVLKAVNEYGWGWTKDNVSKHIKGSDMSIYLFEDKDTGEHRAYFDLS